MVEPAGTESQCRAWGRRIFRGRDLGYSLIPKTHEADWRLLSPILLRRKHILPAEVVEQAEKSTHSLSMQQSMREASGLLLLTPHHYDPTDFKVPIEPTEEEKARMYPPYEWSSKKGLIIKPNLNKDTYLIRRSDTPGLYWRVHLSKSSEGDSVNETVTKTEN
ncbi:unnamed protein product [Trichobilharzia regenti]|nr:unnamed protein product [Trichobilharzia regenti]